MLDLKKVMVVEDLEYTSFALSSIYHVMFKIINTLQHKHNVPRTHKTNMKVLREIARPVSTCIPNGWCDFLEAQLPGTTQDHLQIFNIEMKAKMKSHQMPEQVTSIKL